MIGIDGRKLGIRAWAPEDQPREKFHLKGKFALSEAELLAILLRTGTPNLSAVDLAKQILKRADHDLHNLAAFSMSDLLKIKGVGKAKAIAILAALELGRRKKDAESQVKHKIVGSTEAFEVLKQELLDIHYEVFWILLLNRSNQVIKKQQISQGGVASTVVDAKIIFKIAIEALASGIILAHNHPSGSLAASEADIKLTHKLRDAGALLDIRILDHLIIAGQKYLSFADRGLL